ncbi:hypothetical protein [Cognatilysobacter tabacisoli]|uniref:hypothetical protein n=1 Tax=Cognatilysobacter tabacisoli TaxID=2315424 RepID=UPI0018C88C98|nr:hypothetical protein [Lysobacter tabacisoli]
MHPSSDIAVSRAGYARWLLACAASLALTPAVAQEAGEWSVQVTPYVWGSGIDGSATPFAGAPTITFERSFSEVLEDLDGAFFLSGFARRDRLVLVGDFSYASSSKEGRVPPGIPAEGEFRQTSLTLVAGYRVVDEPGMSIDVLAGARQWRVRSAVDVPLAGISRSPSDEFTDPIVALRTNIALAERWSTVLYADAGGFGVGSDRTSQLVATVNYKITDQAYVSGGYRRLNVDYASGGTRVDVTLDGPLVGVTWRF